MCPVIEPTLIAEHNLDARSMTRRCSQRKQYHRKRNSNKPTSKGWKMVQGLWDFWAAKDRIGSAQGRTEGTVRRAGTADQSMLAWDSSARQISWDARHGCYCCFLGSIAVVKASCSCLARRLALWTKVNAVQAVQSIVLRRSTCSVRKRISRRLTVDDP